MRGGGLYERGFASLKLSLEYLLLLKKGEEIKVLPPFDSLTGLRYLLQREEIIW